MITNSSGTFTCASGAVFEWCREEFSGKGVLGGHFEGRSTDEDVEEVKAYLQTLVPENASAIQAHVLSGPDATTRQQARVLKDQLMGRMGRN